ncbi:MAG: hypothetical protein JWM10_1116, partial [Myxococcaceae bacterium]|nr:hypothetical protein [Myxococcaceae bacterium]
PRRAAARWLLAVAALAASAGGYVSFARRHASSRSRPTPVPLPAVACESVLVLATHDDGARDVLCGTVRETLPRRGEPAVALERFAAPVITAGPVARGWVFVTADGTIARSDTFTGPLRLLGRVPCVRPWVGPARSAGRVALVDLAGALWTTDGTAPATRWSFPSRVRAAVFADTVHGAVVLEHGELLETRDAGRTWPRVDLGHEVAWTVALTPRGIAAATTAGAWRLGPEGPRRDGVHIDRDRMRESATFPTVPSDHAAPASVRAAEVFLVAAIDDHCAPPGADDVSTAAFEAPFGVANTPSYRCHITTGHRGDVQSAAQRPPRAPPGSLVEAPILTGSGSVEAHRWRASDGRERLQLAWWGRDAEGSFSGRAGPETEGLPVRTSVPDEPWRGSEVLVEAISRRGLLLSDDEEGSELLWAAAGGRTTALGRPTLEHFADGTPQRVFTALPDGAVASLMWGCAGSHTVVAAMEIGPDGAVRGHRGLVATPTSPVALGRWGGALGIVLWHPGEPAPQWFHPFDGDAPRALPQPPLTTPRACAGAAPVGDPDAITLWSPRLDLAFEPVTEEDGLMESPGFAAATRYELEWARGEMCVRAVTLNRGGMGYEGLGGVTMTLQARPGDRFEGSLADAGTYRVTCRGR